MKLSEINWDPSMYRKGDEHDPRTVLRGAAVIPTMTTVSKSTRSPMLR